MNNELDATSEPLSRRSFLQASAATSAAATSSALARAEALPVAARGRRPNILFIMTDQQRYDAVGANGNDIIQTPNLDRLAAKAANFSHAFVQAPVCVPARASFFTGRCARSS